MGTLGGVTLCPSILASWTNIWMYMEQKNSFNELIFQIFGSRATEHLDTGKISGLGTMILCFSSHFESLWVHPIASKLEAYL